MKNVFWAASSELKTGRSGGYSGRLCWHPARPGQAGELGREEPDEVQPGQGQGPAPGEEQPQAPAQAGAELLESSSAERDWECWGTTG